MATKAWKAAHPERWREIHAGQERRRRKTQPGTLKATDRRKYTGHKFRWDEKTRRWKSKPENKAKLYRAHVRREYGLLPAEYDKMLAAQAGCAICERKTKLVVDHDHKTGKVRKLLCRACNSMLGQAYDNPSTLRAAARYLERHA